jgi:hypothetical protein
MNLAAILRGMPASGIGGAITLLQRAEDDLALAFLDLSARHTDDHEIHHVARDLAGWSREHVRRLADVGRGHGLDLDPEPSDESAWPVLLKRAADDVLGRLHAPSMLLLADLREVHRTTSGVSLDWEVLAQAAQAAEDSDLVALTAECHPQTLRQLRWANAQVKVLSAQALVAH